MKEYINEELCAKCPHHNCCEIYPLNLNIPTDNLKWGFHNRQQGDWNEQAFKQYGVYPLRDPFLDEETFCEFYDTSIGCIIERKRRPLKCRVHVCDELKANYKEEIDIPMPPVKKVTKFIIKDNKVFPAYDPVDDEEAEKIGKERLDICLQCQFMEKRPNSYACSKCGCHLEYKTKYIYPLDNEGKAFRQIKPDGSYVYVCVLKKW